MMTLLGGCGVKFGGGDESSGGESSESDSTAGDSAVPTTSGTDDTGTSDGSASGDGSTTTGPQGPTDTGLSDSEPSDPTQATSGDLTTGVVDPPACEAMCEHAAECGLTAEPKACAAVCTGEIVDAQPACIEAAGIMLECFALLSCEDLEKALNDLPDQPCSSEQIAKQEACEEPLDCDFAGGGDVDGTMCLLDLECPGDPLRRMECDTEQCLCIFNGELVTSCPAEDVCSDFTKLNDKAVSCCDFPSSGS